MNDQPSVTELMYAGLAALLHKAVSGAVSDWMRGDINLVQLMTTVRQLATWYTGAKAKADVAAAVHNLVTPPE